MFATVTSLTGNCRVEKDPMQQQADPRLIEWYRKYQDWYSRVGRHYMAPPASQVAAGANPGWGPGPPGPGAPPGGFRQPPRYSREITRGKGATYSLPSMGEG